MILARPATRTILNVSRGFHTLPRTLYPFSSSSGDSSRLRKGTASGGWRDTSAIGRQKPSLEQQAQPVRTENPNGLINQDDPVTRILNQPTIVIQRHMEFMNMFLGFEQANRYSVMDSMGNQLGWLVERDFGFTKALLRQVYRLHRPFTVDLWDNNGNVLLTIRRRFSLINSHIKAILPNVQNVADPDGVIVGESVQSWHPWRRRYNLFEKMPELNPANPTDPANDAYVQFGDIDAGFLSWDFAMKNDKDQTSGAVSRNFSGMFREMFTDTGVYVVRMDPVSFQGLEGYYGALAERAPTLDQKAVLLANAVSIDFDYFSRHSNSPGLLVMGGGDDII